jgi:hypothetical protein
MAFYKDILNKKWWFRWIRKYTWFSFRYWWANYLLWIGLIALLIWLLSILKNIEECKKDKEINRILRNIDRRLESCCNCKVIKIETDSLEHDNSLDSLRKSLDACNGPITVTLAWETTDDLDLHLIEPDGTKVYFGNKTSLNGAELDIDMNAGSSNSLNPIENICYKNTPPNGNYKIIIDFFRRNSNQTEIPYTVYIRNGSSEKYYRGVHSIEKDQHLINEFRYPE